MPNISIYCRHYNDGRKMINICNFIIFYNNNGNTINYTCTLYSGSLVTIVNINLPGTICFKFYRPNSRLFIIHPPHLLPRHQLTPPLIPPPPPLPRRDCTRRRARPRTDRFERRRRRREATAGIDKNRPFVQREQKRTKKRYPIRQQKKHTPPSPPHPHLPARHQPHPHAHRLALLREQACGERYVDGGGLHVRPAAFAWVADVGVGLVVGRVLGLR